MIAAKHFDPVLGIDIHMIQPPGPVPPVPVPHPFVGLLIDPVEYAPWIGGTVKVNGLMRGVAGTGGKALPSHIPIGGTFVIPPGNDCNVFMGSKTVSFDSDPASRLGLMVLSCQDVGLPPPPRPKPHYKPKSQYLPTSLVLAVPAGPPVLVGGPPTITIMGALRILGPFIRWIQQASKWAGKFEALSEKLMGWANRVLGRRLGWLANKLICFLTGHPVDVASGQVLTDATDVELPGPLPFRFERTWYSRSDYRGPLGHGWHHSYDLGLTEYPEGVLVRLADGRLAAFDTPDPGAAAFNRLEKLFLRRTADGYELETLGGLVYAFGWAGRPGAERPLAHVRDPNGNRVELVRENGRLVAFIDSGGRRLPVLTDAAGRITEIRGPDQDNAGQTFPLVSYRYGPDGDLVEVRDALGNPFRYEYGSHLLLRETDRAGVSFYFMYDTDGPEARCVRTWGDGDAFLRELTYDVDRQRTEVVNSLGHKSVYEWNDLGAVTREIDPLGGVTKTEWNRFGEKLAVTDPNGKTVRLAYDPFGRLRSVTTPTGGTVSYAYDEAGNNVAYTDPRGRVWKREYDRRRNLVALSDPLGHREQYEVDSRGLPVRWTDPLGRTAVSEWTAAGLLRRVVDRCGGQTTFEYDALGRLLGWSDAAGGVVRNRYDRRGLLVELTDPSGRHHRLSHDAAGYLASVTDPAGRTTEYAHTVMGRLASVRTPSGRVLRYRYDTEGELSELEDPGKSVWRYSRDANGRVIEEQTRDGRRLQYVYDAAGQVSEFVNARGQSIKLKRDAAGRVVARVWPDGSQDAFAYDPSGAKTVATNAAAVAKWAYDPCGRIASEVLNGRAVRHRYDAAGNLVGRSSPLGRNLRLEYDAEGRLVAAADGPDELFRSTLDPLGREWRRVTLAGAGWEWEYLPTGELSAVRVRGAVAFDRTHTYDPSGTPTAQADTEFGESRYTHDADGRLIAVRHADGTGQEYRYDLAGTIQPPVGVVVRRDADGNTVEKHGPSGRWAYAYDPLGRLERASADGGAEVLFAYDALGRRVRKT
ncbi:MAG TPA: DUF6531 domain-containing protein, partial [Gemmataceae bacterium]|nr:DUF6531 domain-containing protein [Gemmataceae bacterium]